MNPLALVSAIAGGIVGAAIWAIVAYSFLAPQAQEFVELKPERQYAEFMIRFGHTEVQSVDGMPVAQLQNFSALVVPLLRRIGEEQPLFDEWKP